MKSKRKATYINTFVYNIEGNTYYKLNLLVPDTNEKQEYIHERLKMVSISAKIDSKEIQTLEPLTEYYFEVEIIEYGDKLKQYITNILKA